MFVMHKINSHKRWNPAANPLFTATLSPRNVTEKEAEPINRTDQPRDSSAKAVSVDPMSRKPNAKAVVSSEASAKTHEVMFFKDVKFGPQEGELRFRLIHFWEARNAIKKVLIGIEMLLIDEQVYSDIFVLLFFFVMLDR